ncbi:MORN repeat-containing protein 3 [Sardina pilchardus]|uniref:MORN repeat-containing protein 3 n=1 Tax=Sardina pilchardus TaxID=27697 RepID=UPI002E14352D
MPHKKIPKTTVPPVKIWEQKAQKCGLLHSVYSVNGDKYTGEWLDNKKHGKGTQVWKKSGVIYDGDWKYDKRDGYGTFSRLDPATNDYKRIYCGEWKNGKKDGFGTHFYGENSWYEGEWNEGLRFGWGRMYYANGDTYEGEWLKDNHHGQGMLRLANENRYEGGWRQGKKHGPGKFLYQKKGQLYEGSWENGVAKCGTVSDFGREEASNPTMYPIPQVRLLDMNAVLMETSCLVEVDSTES